MKTWIHIIIFNIRPFFAPFFDCAFCTHHQTPEAIWKWAKCLAGIYHYLSQADTNWSDRTWDSTTNSYQSQSWEEWNYLVHQEKHSVLILPSSNKTDLHCDVTDATAATPNLLRSRHFFQTNTHTHMFSLKPGEKDLENPTRRGSYDWSCLPNYYFKGQEWALAQGLNMIRLLLPLCRMSQAYSDLWGADFAGWYKSNKSSLRALHRLSDEMLGDECSNYLNHLSWLYGSRAI